MGNTYSFELDDYGPGNTGLERNFYMGVYSDEEILTKDALFAYYPFGGNPYDASYYPYTGQNYDASYHGNDLSTTGVFTDVSDRFGNGWHALYFDDAGTESYMEEDFPQYFPESNGAKSISAWFKLGESYNSGHYYDIAGFGSPLTRQNFQLSIRYNKLGVKGWGSSYDWFPDVNAPSDNDWHHFTATYDGSTTRLYLDGEEKAFTTAYSFPCNDPDRIIIGNEIDKSGWEFNGCIDDVGCYKKTLNLKEILDLYHINGWNTDPDLVAYYPFNGNCNDESGNNNHCKPHYTVDLDSDRFNSDWQAYQFYRGGDIDGYVGSFTQDFQGIPAGNVPKSVSAWYRLNGGYDPDSHYDIAGCGLASNQRNFQLSIKDNKLGVKGWGGQYDWWSDYEVPEDNNWHHVAATYDGNTTRLYLDGEEKDFTTGFDFITDNPQNIAIGNEIDQTGWEFSGGIDDVRIYKRCLSGSDVNDLYQEGGY